jgi:hypothetical protein
MTDRQTIRAKALELAMLSFSVHHDGLFERMTNPGTSAIPPLLAQRAAAIEDYIKRSDPKAAEL